MRRRIVGLDLNGRYDLAARDWMDDETFELLEIPKIIKGGTKADVVITLANRLARDLFNLNPPPITPRIDPWQFAATTLARIAGRSAPPVGQRLPPVTPEACFQHDAGASRQPAGTRRPRARSRQACRFGDVAHTALANVPRTFTPVLRTVAPWWAADKMLCGRMFPFDQIKL